MMLKLFACFLFASLFFAHYFCAIDIEIPSKEVDQRISIVSKLMEQCFDSQAIILITSSPCNSSISSDLYKSMTQFVSFLNKSSNYKIPANQNTPISCIIMILTSPAEIKRVLLNETWRNFDQSFIILDGDNDSGCINAQSFLMEAWKNDILNVIFICFDHQNQIPKIYSFNPFTSSAPTSWMKISVVPGTNDHPWTLFSQNYTVGDTLCINLFYDKSGNLGRYVFKAIVYYQQPYISCAINSGIKNCKGFDWEIMKLLEFKLNMRLQVYFLDHKILAKLEHKVKRHVRLEINQKKYHLTLNSIRMKVVREYGEITNPFYQSGFSVITRSRELKALNGYLFAFLPVSTVSLLFITSVIIFILLRYLLRDPYSQNFIDTVRFFLNLPLPRLPVTIRGRVVFGVTFLSFTIANIVIQASMSTVLIATNTARNVEEIKDLKELGYNILSDGQNPYFTKNLGSKDPVKYSNISSCLQLGDKEAFAGIEMDLQPLITEHCHMPRESLIANKFYCYFTSRNWPIFPEMNKKLLMLIESGLTDYYIKNAQAKYQHSKHQELEQYQKITIDHMKYIFYGFIMLSLISIIVFGIELFIARQSRLIDTTD